MMQPGKTVSATAGRINSLLSESGANDPIGPTSSDYRLQATIS
jgi:hypothetical protein